MSPYVELRAKSFYSFGEGASHLHELLTRAAALGYPALALTDTNLCGGYEFAKLAKQWGVTPITGGQIPLGNGARLTLLAKSRLGYANLARLFTYANFADRRDPRLDPKRLPNHAEGLVMITGFCDSPLSQLLMDGRPDEAEHLLKSYLDWFGCDSVFMGLQQNMVFGDTERNRKLVELASRLNVPLAAANDVHYHSPNRHKLQNVLTAVKGNCTLDEAVYQIKPCKEFYLKSSEQMGHLFKEHPEAVKNTLRIAGICQFNLTSSLGYKLPLSPVPEGYTQESFLERICLEAAQRRYGGLPEKVRTRLQEEMHLIRKHGLAGFLLLYRDIVLIAHEIMIESGLTPPETPRELREKLIKRIHERFGPEHAVLAGAISTYKIRGIIADVGKALGLTQDSLHRLTDAPNSHNPAGLKNEMHRRADFRDKVNAGGWRELIELAPQLEGAPKGLGQHVGGLILSSWPVPDMVPIREGAIPGRYIMDWDKDTVADAGLAKIDLLPLPVLDQIDDALDLAEQRAGRRVDLAQIGSNDPRVYDMINQGRNIGAFLLQSPAQLKMSQRLRARNLNDLAYQVALVRPGVGVQGSAVNKFIERYRQGVPWPYDHPLEQRSLERSCGIIIWQEQVVQIIADVGGMTTAEADESRRAFVKVKNGPLLARYKTRFMEGATRQGVTPDIAERIWAKINGHYMVPESHSYAFGINAYQAAWLKCYYPVEFFTALFNR